MRIASWAILRRDAATKRRQTCITVGAVLSWLTSAALFYIPLMQLAGLCMHDERASHMPLIPSVSAALVLMRRRVVFRRCAWSPAAGSGVIAAGVTLLLFGPDTLAKIGFSERLPVEIFAIVLVWIGIFTFWYGTQALKAASFPLLFLFLTVPLPAAFIEKVVGLLQKGSAETADVLFRVMGMAYLRRGFTFSLPGVDIDIAAECSGIRSALSLVTAALLGGHFLLRSFWQKACLCLLTIPISIFKNAVRIVTISWLGVYVNPDFFHGAIHRRGGLPFSLVALALLALSLILLRDRASSRRAFG